MKHLMAALLCLLLCGCSREPVPDRQETVPEFTAEPVITELYQPHHPMEQQYPGLVRAYTLPQDRILGIAALENDLLVLSGQETTTLTLYTGETLRKAASLTLDFLLLPEDVRIHTQSISYFDPQQQATILLDPQLQPIRRIVAPEGLSGKPILSDNGNTLYYCTGWSVVAWDLEHGIRRTLKEMAYDTQELSALHLEDRILECRILDEGISTRLLLSADQGLEAGTLPENASLHTGGARYFAALTSGYQKLMLLGESESPPKLLLPADAWEDSFYLPEDHAAVTLQSLASGFRLDYYELSTGILRSSLNLDTAPWQIANTKGHGIYILAPDPAEDRNMLYRWDVLRQPPDPSNTASFLTAYPSPENPDTEALEACREYANTIGQKFGIQVLVWEDAVAVQPWDYRFQPEHLAPVLQKELQLLEERLEQYPEGILAQTKEHFGKLTICLVRSITGTDEAQSLSSATGIQFFAENEAYVVITTGTYSRQALYHELYHVMETHILTESTALDLWESLNPSAFVYGQESPGDDIYLQGQTRAFVDRYAMRYPKEDRARVLENAMLPDRQDIFRSEYMQRKLHALCSGIREAYGLKKHPDPLPWEQYLMNPLVPKA